ncbi:2-C-methyl-D-erythritol 2,4-cyclodiphosphate synthase [Gemmatimonadota bacterium]
MRVGFGYDSHRFDPDRPLVLGGILIPGSPGLAGHSDGDAVAHALIDALLGAAAEGNVGSHFPPGEEEWKGADSMDLLERSVEVLREAGFRPGNVDVTVICQRPKIGPVAQAMRERLGGVLGLATGAVSVKGKTNEGMGWIGAEEGLAVHAVALLVPLEG